MPFSILYFRFIAPFVSEPDGIESKLIIIRVLKLAVIVMFWPVACAQGPEAVDFADPLTGPVSPWLVIPFEKYALTPQGLLRTTADSGTENGIDRPIVRTVSGRYLDRDFVFEIDVTIPPDHGELAYVGFGSAQNDVSYENEPTHAFLFRIHNLPQIPMYSIDVAIADPNAGKGFRGKYREFHRAGEYASGKTMRFQIIHRGDTVTLAVPAIPAAKVTYSPEQYRQLFDRSNAYLFFTNSSQGTTFSNVSLRTP